MKALIVAGGQRPSARLLNEVLSEGYRFIIAADRGARVLLEENIPFQLLVGDLDSLDPVSLAAIPDTVEVVALSPEKDFSDTEAAFWEARRRGADSVVILGGTGSRQDHFLANLALLETALDAGVAACLADDHNRIFIAKGDQDIAPLDGWKISFFPWGGNVPDFSVSNVRYPLRNHCLSSASTLSVSNEFLKGPAHISFSKGAVLIMLSRD